MTTPADHSPNVFRRRSAAVLSGDVVGFTRLVADDLASTVEALEAARDITTSAVDEAGGSLIDFPGDEFMAVLPSVSAAVHAARNLRERVASHQTDVPEHRRLAFRLGIAVGELVTDDRRIYGEVVNLAARVRETAPPGGIALAGDAYVRLDEPRTPFEPLGLRRFKNVPAPAYVFLLRDAAMEDRGVAGRRVGTRPCIAFDGVQRRSDAPDAVRAADILTKELRTALVRVPGIEVAAPGRSAIDEDGPGPTHFLEVSIEHLGTEIRVYSELLDTGRWVPVWGDRYDFDATQLAVHLDAMVESITGAVEVETYFGEHGMTWRSSLSHESLNLMYRAWEQLLLETPESLRRAEELALRVAATDVHAADGPSVAAFAMVVRLALGLSSDPEGDLARAGSLARDALDRGDATGLGETVLAHILMTSGDAAAAKEAIDRAVAVRRTCNATYAVRASVLRYLGEWPEAIENIHHAISLTPTHLPWYWTVLASAAYVGERYEEVVEAVEPLVASGTASLEALLLLAASQAALGMTRRAAVTADQVRQEHPSVRAAAAVARHPFVDVDIIERWQRHLAAAGVS